jgi:anti-sigma B factor antagonist
VYGLAITHSTDTDEGDIMRLVGDLDHVTAATFQRETDALVADRTTRLVLDLTSVGFIDSSGLSAIVDLSHRLKMSGGEVAIVCPDGGPRRIFERTGLGAFLRLSKTHAEAVESLGA